MSKNAESYDFDGLQGASVRDVLRLCDRIDSESLELARMLLESDEAGIQAVNTADDRRLYAVLKPIRQENITRIHNVLIEMPGRDLAEFLATFDAIICESWEPQ